jgi:hypothetical protein
MVQILRQSTEIKVRIGPFVDVTDGFTPETGITLGAADEAEALKANGAATADISAATWAAVTSCRGYYDLTLTTSHTDTVGTLGIVIQDDSVCLPVVRYFQIIEESAYDAMFAASAAGPLQSTVAGRKLDVSTDGEAGIDWANVGSPTTSVNLSSTTTNLVNTVTTYTGNTKQTGDSFARIGATGSGLTSLASAANLATVDTVVDGIQTDLSNATDGLGAIKTDTAAILVDTAEIGAAGAGLTALATAASISALNDPTAATIADAVWDEAQSGHTTAGTFGKYLDAQVSAASTPPTAAAIADAVWDEAIAGHAVSGSTGEQLSAAGAAGDPWATALPGAYGSGTAGKLVGDNINAPIATVDTVVDAIASTLGSPAGASVSADIAAVKSDSAAILTDTGTTIPAQIGTPVGADISADIAAVKSDTAAVLVDTAEIGSAGAGLTALATAANLATVDTVVDGIQTDLSNATDGLGAIKADTAAILVDTAEIGAAGVGLTALASASNLATVDTVVDGIQTDLSNATDGLGAIKTDTAAILADTGTDGVVVASASKTGYRLSATGVDDVLDEVVEGSYTFRQYLRGFASALFGKASGMATTSPAIRDTADSKDRITGTADSSGNRTSVTLDLT